MLFKTVSSVTLAGWVRVFESRLWQGCWSIVFLCGFSPCYDLAFRTSSASCFNGDLENYSRGSFAWNGLSLSQSDVCDL